MRRVHRNRARLACAWLVTVGAAASLASCSAGSTIAEPSSPPGSATTSQQSGSADGSDIESRRDAYDLKLAQCLRSQGFDVKDPQPGEGIQETAEGLNAAAATCRTEIGDPPTNDLTAEDVAAIQDIYLEWAGCFRDRGYDSPDPATDMAFAIPEGASEKDIAECTEVPE